MNREVVIEWLTKVSQLEPGNEVYIPALDKQQQKTAWKQFLKELRILHRIDPIAASGIQVTRTFKDNRHWVVLIKTALDSTIGFIKSPTGELKRFSVGQALSSEQKRMIELMQEDGYSLEEITDQLGLSTAEIEEITKWLKQDLKDLASS
jgi:hypothetical protein